MQWNEKLKDVLGASRGRGQSLEHVACSVLVPIGVDAATGRCDIVLTKRTMSVETHKGQVSFPGGFFEPHDADLKVTALRESEEEIGTNPADIEILGQLDLVTTRGGIAICPWVGRLPLPYAFRVNDREVERILYLSVSDLLSRGLHEVSVDVGDYRVNSIGIEVDGNLVWGATARVLLQLRELLLD